MADINTIIDTHTVHHDFLFNDAAADNGFDDRLAVSDFQGKAGSGGLYQQTGVPTVPSDLAFDSEGTRYNSTAEAFDTGGSTGTVMAIVKIPASHATSLALYGRGRASSGNLKNILTISGAGNVRFESRENGTSSRYVEDATFDVADGAWHMIFVSQPGDSSGVNFHIDGAEITARALSILNGSATVDQWFDTNTPDRSSLMKGPATSDTGILDALVSRLTLFETVLSNAQMTAIYNEWASSGPNFSNKTIRRKNRRIYFDI